MRVAKLGSSLLALAVAGSIMQSLAGANPLTGFVGLPDCSDFDTEPGEQGELIIMRRAPSGCGAPSLDTDLLFDLHLKGGGATLYTSVLPNDWETNGDWQCSVQPRDVAFVRIAMPPNGPSLPGKLVLDSGDESSVDLGVTSAFLIGNSLPVGLDAGIGLRIPGTRTTYDVDFGSTSATFPRSDASGVTVAFAPLPDVNGGDRVPGACTISGSLHDPLDPARGGILGYAVYRIPALPGRTGSTAEFTRALTDGDPATGFQTFISLRSFRLDVACDVTVDPSVNDLDPGDGAVLHDPDGRFGSGDEVIVWTDARADSPRAHPERAPDPSKAYFYAVQPVSQGSLTSVVPCFSVNCEFAGDHLRDFDGDGEPDSLNVDSTDPSDLAVEFISPQAETAEGSQPGLGFTWHSELLLSAPMFSSIVSDVLRRSTAITALSPGPSPPLATILPLDGSDDYRTPFVTGDVDPDLSIVNTPRAHLLVFYEVPGQDDLHLRIVPGAGGRVVQFTF